LPSFNPGYTRFKSSRHEQASDKSRYVRDMFTGISPTYDRLNRLLSMRLDVGWRKKLVALSGIKSGEKVLDVCTGTGDVLLEFQRRVPGCGGVGLDFSEGMLVVAREKPFGPGFNLKQGDALKLPFKKASFETSCMAFGLRNVVDVTRAFREMARVVRPGRKILALELTRPSNPLLRALYLPYLHFYLPLMGKLVSGNREAYRYLRDTIERFFTPAEVLGFMAQAGLKECQAVRLSGGIATLYVGTVPAKGRRG
jgi:demethylmenaquinone methyltransferase/2-methoxy-6-polyprenyl-1,4-benzoquinol methylase